METKANITSRNDVQSIWSTDYAGKRVGKR